MVMREKLAQIRMWIFSQFGIHFQLVLECELVCNVCELDGDCLRATCLGIQLVESVLQEWFELPTGCGCPDGWVETLVSE
jgi:hypothetical protein